MAVIYSLPPDGLVNVGGEGRLAENLISLFLFNECPPGPISNQVNSGI